MNSLCQQPVFAALRLPQRVVFGELVQTPADEAAAEGEESDTQGEELHLILQFAREQAKQHNLTTI